MPEPTLNATQKRALAGALLACPSMANHAGRDAIIRELPVDIQHSITRSDAGLLDVTNTISASLNYPRGLAILIDLVRLCEGDSRPMRQVDKGVAESTRAAPVEQSIQTSRYSAVPAEPSTDWDVFISHAWEDKDAIARPLAEALRARGLRVWYDEYTLSLGDRLRRSIDLGLARCRYGIVILSPHFFAKEWPQKELDGLVQRENRGEKVILPVWHNMDAEQIRRYSPPLADRIGVRSDAGLQRVVAEVLRVAGRIHGEPTTQQKGAASPWDRSGTATVVLPSIVGDRWVLEAPLHMEFVRIPAGEFLMGSDPQVDKAAQDLEQRQHGVYLPEYSIGKYPVTAGQYAVFARATRREVAGQQGGPDHPVVNVTWDDAQVFCRWLSQRSDLAVRLPSEAEWEKAARGTDGRIYPWGDEPPSEERCNFGDSVKATTPVGTYPAGASPYGILDMAGNVWEWTNTLWHPSGERTSFRYPYNARDGREDLSASGLRVLRGGAFLVDAGYVRCACRYWFDPVFRDRYVGFRVVASPSHS